MKKISWCNYSFLITNEADLVRSFKPKVIVGSGAIHFANVYTLFCADNDQNLKRILSTEEMVSDGVPISFLLSRLVGKKFTQIRGPSFMRNALINCEKEVRHFLLGSSKGNLEILKRNFEGIRPELRIVGTLAPGHFESIDSEVSKWINQITETSPDIVWVGLGTPKQDFVISYLANQIRANFVGVGAAFDFLAGTKNEAPKWIRSIGMEWLFRFMHEPKRLWHRYTFGNAHFIYRYVAPTFFKIWKNKILSRKNLEIP